MSRHADLDVISADHLQSDAAAGKHPWAPVAPQQVQSAQDQAEELELVAHSEKVLILQEVDVPDSVSPRVAWARTSIVKCLDLTICVDL
jgi:hypothetical protein